MKYTMVTIVVVLFGIVLTLTVNTNESQEDETDMDDHTYATTLPMEFDKCCAMWLIKRFVDKEAKFKIYPLGTYVTGRRSFDVASAAWSRQHKKCTSDCIWEDLNIDNKIAQQIVGMAHHIELNHWSPDSFPLASECNRELLSIVAQTPDSNDCALQTNIFFDELYDKLKNE